MTKHIFWFLFLHFRFRISWFGSSLIDGVWVATCRLEMKKIEIIILLLSKCLCKFLGFFLSDPQCARLLFLSFYFSLLKFVFFVMLIIYCKFVCWCLWQMVKRCLISICLEELGSHVCTCLLVHNTLDHLKQAVYCPCPIPCGQFGLGLIWLNNFLFFFITSILAQCIHVDKV